MSNDDSAPVIAAQTRLDELRLQVGNRHPEYATGLNRLAMQLIMQGSIEPAEPLLREALEIRRETLGPKNPEYATNLISLRGLLWAKGDLQESEELMRDALDIRWEVMGRDHPKTLAVLKSLEQLMLAKRATLGDSPSGSLETENTPEPTDASILTEEDKTLVEASPRESVEEAGVVGVFAQGNSTGLLVETTETQPAEAEAVARFDGDFEAYQGQPHPSTHESHDDSVNSREMAGRNGADYPSEPALSGTPAEEPTSVERAGGERVLATRAELLGDCERRKHQFNQAGDLLSREAERWSIEGVPPSASLIDHLGACTRDFNTLRVNVLELAGSLGVSLDSVQLTNVLEVEHLLQVLGEVEGRHAQFESIRGLALGQLDRLLTLAHVERDDFEPLQACQEQAKQLYNAIANAPVLELPAEASELAEGTHPLHSLLALAEGESLDDELWSVSLEQVENHFGKALSVALGRSKIIQP